jgi:D-serine deaminase-like pyridoxal phosphate-dependent protein
MAADDDVRQATPYLCVDSEQLDRNLAAMQARCDAAGVRLRPHAKGHRSAWIAARQMQLGACGIAVATAPEAVCMLGAGIADVLITSALAPGAAAIAAEASRLGEVSVVAGSEDGVRLLADAAAQAGVTLPVLVDVDVGQRRGGAADSDAAVRLAEAVSDSDELTLAGVQAYEGHLQAIPDGGERTRLHEQAMARLRVILDAMSRRGFAPAWVTTAGTGTSTAALASDIVSEIQPGSYALMDHTYLRSADPTFQPAARIITSVIAVLADDEVIVDAGNRAVSTDLGPPHVASRTASWELAGDEHGRLRGELGDLRVGDTVALIPSHSDTTVPLYDSFSLSGATGLRLPVTRPR